jgi:exo-beta-1,3-glucanase (GH17 family)
MSGATVTGWTPFETLPLDWQSVGTADLTGDGQPDVLWESSLAGERGIWRMNGAAIIGWTSFGAVPTNWHIVGAADFTGDGQPDVLWQDLSTGEVGIWRMNETVLQGWTSFGAVPTNWHAVGAADFTGDGKTDVLWEDVTTGQRGIWQMNGTAITGWVPFGAVPTEWHIAGASDFTGDGLPDVLWQDLATGEVGVWRMTGTTIAAWEPFGAVPPEWHARGSLLLVPAAPMPLYGLDFSPYLDGQDPTLGSTVTESQIRARLAQVQPFTRWVRSFGMTGGLEAIGRLSHDDGLQVACGAWLSGNADANETEISNLIAAATHGSCDLAIVGSETLLRGDLSDIQLVSYIQTVKSQVRGVPVATADVYTQLLLHPSVLAAVDVIMPNIYPYWEGVSLENAVGEVNAVYRQMLASAGGKPIVISETGWPSCGNSVGNAVPSPANASTYFTTFISWARATGTSYFYFDALDEAWKTRAEGPQGACWGIMTSSGDLKPGMLHVFEGATVPDTWSGSQPVGGPGVPSLSFTYVPPIGNSQRLRGQVMHLAPGSYKVAVYIRVGASWWTKPYAAIPTTILLPDGTWSCDIATGGSDTQATEIAAFAVPIAYAPPVLLGAASIPLEVQRTAAASADVMR